MLQVYYYCSYENSQQGFMIGRIEIGESVSKTQLTPVYSDGIPLLISRSFEFGDICEAWGHIVGSEDSWIVMKKNTEKKLQGKNDSGKRVLINICFETSEVIQYRRIKRFCDEKEKSDELFNALVRTIVITDEWPLGIDVEYDALRALIDEFGSVSLSEDTWAQDESFYIRPRSSNADTIRKEMTLDKQGGYGKYLDIKYYDHDRNIYEIYELDKEREPICGGEKDKSPKGGGDKEVYRTIQDIENIANEKPKSILKEVMKGAGKLVSFIFDDPQQAAHGSACENRDMRGHDGDCSYTYARPSQMHQDVHEGKVSVDASESEHSKDTASNDTDATQVEAVSSCGSLVSSFGHKSTDSSESENIGVDTQLLLQAPLFMSEAPSQETVKETSVGSESEKTISG